MYTTCLHCHADLGANEQLEAFPVGRRLVFDGQRGRLWVVCTTCARWNLSPLDERWEVIEACERLYRDTPKRLSTDQIGLAKLPDGMVLVRIGEPVFPEYASWRYGRVFARRDLTSLWSAQAGGVAVLATLLMMGGPLLAVSGAGMTAFGTFYLGRSAIRYLTGLRIVGDVTLGDGSIRPLSVARARRARVAMARDGRWTLALPGYGSSVIRPMVAVETGDDIDAVETFDLVAPEHAEMVARRVMPVVNAAGGDDDMVRGASKLHEQWEGKIGETVGKLIDFQGSPMGFAGEPHLALAFEMSVYEEQERRWLETQLYLLKAAWKEAERLASIADSLTLPEWLEARMERMKEGAPLPKAPM